VGEYLFHKFDKDGNGMIDNIEFDQKGFITIIPMEKDTLKMVDYDEDGRADTQQYTEQDFIQDSHLARFDQNKDGLTPAEFIGLGYKELDENHDNLIGIDEWRDAYMASVRPEIDKPHHYNH